MHPRIHLLCVLPVALALPWLAWSFAAAILAATLMLHVVAGPAALRALGRSVWRLRWLLLAIALLYPIFPAAAASRLDSALLGLRQLLLLLAMLAAVHTLLWWQGSARLGSALSELLRPLDRIGFPVDRFSCRLAGVLASAGEVESKLRRARDTDSLRAGDAAGFLAAEIRRLESGDVGINEPGLERLAPPRPIEWLLPSAVVLVLALMFLPGVLPAWAT
jgi:biotin transport system permease protein